MCGIYLRIERQQGDYSRQQQSFEEFSAMRHRGPDSSIFCVKELQLGHERYEVHYGFHRLAINDRSDAANQPFTYEDGSFAMCNGEIYNFAQLQEKQLASYPFRSRSDCEVLFPLYEQYGVQMVDYLDGVFALVLYSAQEKCFYIARDSLGEKPLYIGISEDSLVIASELKAAIHNEVQQFPPGTYAVIRGLGSVNCTQFFEYPTLGSQPISFTASVEALQEKLVDAVAKRLMSDVPVGVLLSGGIDSSGVAAIAAQLYPGQLKTFSIGVADSTDLHYARRVADYLGTEHHEVQVSIEDALKEADAIIRVIETFNPVLVPNHILLYFLAKYIREKTDVRVLLDGIGPDEALGGYRFFAEAPSEAAYDEEIQHQVQDLHKTELLGERTFAAFGLETRSPYLDTALLRFLLALPTEYRMSRSAYTNYEVKEKLLLRKALTGRLPREILERGKVPMPEGVGKVYLDTFEQAICDRVQEQVFKQEQQQFPLLHRTEYYYKQIFYNHFPWATQVVCGVQHAPWRSYQPNAVVYENT
ncbi:asparagine synthase (glutamine-hydrolyzing) [Nostoc sp. NMS4]|uniref:asparagine synthase (glutamine-hydrolyzing) n=1 Tax=Nostoc sp. NMS4 TaxID=2815390 RepID=UPI0025F5399A|nr:asparagine synthase (glutamine-hydrolyzing) [Nostoc sp. NMS4]MBN3923482.1 asparagine synthase (glutamine-hydrolyzing) [Nostoc sp. NMS4]